MSERRAARVAAAALLAAVALAPAAGAQRMRTMTSARQLQGERALNVRIEYGAGKLTVAPGSGDLLYRLALRYDEAKFRPVTEYDRAAGRLKLGVESRDHGDVNGSTRDQSATVELTPSVPTDLSLAFGAGDARVELGGLALSRVRVQTGASQTEVSFTRPNRVAAREVRIDAGAAELRVNGLGNTRASRFEFSGGVGSATLDFGGAWSGNATARIEMGLGSVRLRLPRSLGVRMTKDSFLTSFSPSGMVKRGNAWYSRGYDQARYRLDVSISAAIGSIDVEWTE